MNVAILVDTSFRSRHFEAMLLYRHIYRVILVNIDFLIDYLLIDKLFGGMIDIKQVVFYF